MAEIRHACEGGLTPECFKKFPQYAKKVFAYRLMHTLCPARMTRKLRESLWKALTRVPVSWIPFEYFIFPPDFEWDLIFPEDWTPEDPPPEGVIVDPEVEFPEDWTPDDGLPDGVTIDLPLILPPYWETEDPLPFGITVDPEYRIQIPQLKLMYIFIAPGRTWEEVFPNGWDPNTPLPGGASWEPYYTLPVYDFAKDLSAEPLTPEQLQDAVFRKTGSRPRRQPLTPAQMRRGDAAQYGTAPPLYMGPWEPGPAHRPLGGAVAAEEIWFYDDFDNLTDAAWINDSYANGSATIVGGKLQLEGLDGDSGAGIHRTDPKGGILNFDLSFEQRYIEYEDYSYMYFYTGSHGLGIEFYPPNNISLPPDKWWIQTDVGNYIGETITWKLEVRDGILTVYKNDVAVVTDHALAEQTYGPGQMSLFSSMTQTIIIDDFTIREV